MNGAELTRDKLIERIATGFVVPMDREVLKLYGTARLRDDLEYLERMGRRRGAWGSRPCSTSPPSSG